MFPPELVQGTFRTPLIDGVHINKNYNMLHQRTSLVLGDVLFPLKWLWFAYTNGSSKLNKGQQPIAQLLMSGIMYGEGPRFSLKENALYFSDMLAKQVIRYDINTKESTIIYHGEDDTSGLGWLPDGRMLIVAMNTRKLLALNQSTKEITEYADLSNVTRFKVNDMVIDIQGRAYVGNFGWDYVDDLYHPYTTTLVRVDPATSTHPEVVSTDMYFPNGSVITPDGKTLIVAETFRAHLVAFDIATDGSLSNRRVWAHIGLPTDGICLDAEGCVWVATPQIGIYKTGGALIRVREGGEITHVYGFGKHGITYGVYACTLGTDQSTGQHKLFFLEAKAAEEPIVMKHGEELARENGVLKCIDVPVGPAVHPTNRRYCAGYC